MLLASCSLVASTAIHPLPAVQSSAVAAMQPDDVEESRTEQVALAIAAAVVVASAAAMRADPSADTAGIAAVPVAASAVETALPLSVPAVEMLAVAVWPGMLTERQERMKVASTSSDSEIRTEEPAEELEQTAAQPAAAEVPPAAVPALAVLSTA